MSPTDVSQKSSLITHHDVVFYGQKEGDTGLRAKIYCFNEDEHVVTCDFYDEVGTHVNDWSGNPNTVVTLVYPMSMYGHILDALRHEEDLYFSYLVEKHQGYIGRDPRKRP